MIFRFAGGLFRGLYHPLRHRTAGGGKGQKQTREFESLWGVGVSPTQGGGGGQGPPYLPAAPLDTRGTNTNERLSAAGIRGGIGGVGGLPPVSPRLVRKQLMTRPACRSAGSHTECRICHTELLTQKTCPHPTFLLCHTNGPGAGNLLAGTLGLWRLKTGLAETVIFFFRRDRATFFTDILI